MEAEYEKENVLPATNGVRALNLASATTHRRRKRSAKQQAAGGVRPVSSVDTTKSAVSQMPKSTNTKRKNNGVSRRQALGATAPTTPMQDVTSKNQRPSNSSDAGAASEKKNSTPSVKSTLRALQKKFRTKRQDDRNGGQGWCEGETLNMHDSLNAVLAAVITGNMKDDAIPDCSQPSTSNDLCTGELINDGALDSYDDVEDVECVETQMCQSMMDAPSTAISVEDYITATPARCASVVTEVDGPTTVPAIPEDEEELVEDYPDLDDEVDAESTTLSAPPAQVSTMPVWRVTRVAQSWAQPLALGPQYPSANPTLTSEQDIELQQCRQWLLTVVRALWDVVPDHLKQGATPVCMLAEDLAMPATTAVRFPIDPDADNAVPLLSSPTDDQPVQISNRFMRETIARWNTIRPLNHLPTLNLFYCLFENLLLIGRNLPVVLSKHTVVKVVEMMQYNPKLNARMAEWPLHSVAMSRRKTDVQLPDYVTELAEVIYAMQYIKDRIIPWVCDESRFGNFNQYLARLKANILRCVVEDEDILREIFTVLQDPFQQPIGRILSHLRFLQEFLEMQKADNLTDGKLCWEVLLNQYHFIPTITVLLGSSDPRVRKASADVCLYLTEEDCRPLLQPHLIEHTDFLHRLLDIFKNPNCDEALALQLQTFLPMLMVFPIVDVLPIFYAACGDVVAHWTAVCKENAHVFCPNQLARRATVDLELAGAPIDVSMKQSSEAKEKTSTTESTEGDSAALTKVPSAASDLPSAMCVNAFLEMASLCVHHHHRSFAFHSDEFVQRLVVLLATLWSKATSVPPDTLIASNKVMLSLLHLQSDQIYSLVKEHLVFDGILRAFEDGNNALNSSVLTLLHTILQLDIGSLITHIHDLWFSGPSVSTKLNMDACSVVRLFAERVVRGDFGSCGSV